MNLNVFQMVAIADAMEISQQVEDENFTNMQDKSIQQLLETIDVGKVCFERYTKRPASVFDSPAENRLILDAFDSSRRTLMRLARGEEI